MIVSHIDDDHVHGVLDLTGKLVEARNAGRAEDFDVRNLWHNSFDDVAGDSASAKLAALPQIATAASTDVAVPVGLPIGRPAAAVLASVGQGRKLRDNARRLNIPINGQFAGLVTRGRAAAKAVDLDAGAKAKVLGPGEEQVETLHREWRKYVDKGTASDPATVAEYLDKSVLNLSSIVLLVEAGQQSVLLTGDARGDFILGSLEASGVVKPGEAIHVNIFKLPHHGSVRNVEPDLFERVTADHYVISADGSYHNPDIGTLRMLSDARPDDDFTIWLTNREMRKGIGEAVAKFVDEQRTAGRAYRIAFRRDADLGVRIDLGDPLAC